MLQSSRLLPIRTQWLGNIRGDLLAAIVVALALIPEAIAFSIMAGLDPKVGLYASFSIAIITAFTGGRPAMISAATGAMAILMISLVKDHGVEYLFAATILTGIIQFIFGVFRLGRYLRFVPKAVMVGFVNALAIVIFQAQLEQFTNTHWSIYPMVVIGLAIIYLFPRITKAVPSPLIAIVALTLFTLFTNSPLRTVGDMGELPTSLPMFLIPNVPFNLETLLIILPYALPLALVGLIESLLTATIVDDMTGTSSDKNREARGQGIANFITGFLGGMAGCAMIGQSVINVSSGGRSRLSTLAAGVFLLIFILVFGSAINVIPMAALVAVMVMVSINTFDWKSIPQMRVNSIPYNLVLLGTMATVLYTHNLALGVLVGILLSCVFFAREIARSLTITSTLDAAAESRTYLIHGQLFFVSTEIFLEAFDTAEAVKDVTIDLTHAHLWDATAISAIDKVVLRFKKNLIPVTIIGMNEASATIFGKLATHDRPNAGETPLH